MRIAGLGTATAQSEPVEMRLERTRDATARYRARVPEGSAPAPSSQSGLTLPEIMLRLQRLMGN